MSTQQQFSLTDAEFAEIQAALESTVRGRAFLRAYAEQNRLVAYNAVVELTRELKEWTERKISDAAEQAQISVLRRELQEMSACIQRTRNEIAAMQMKTGDGNANSRIMLATGELDAIVSHTEQATSNILNAAERILEIAAQLPPEHAALAAQLSEQATDILTECSFQDLTGQRITKVVNTLRYLEQRVHAMVEIWGADSITPTSVVLPTDPRPDAHLLNGPARPGEGRSQEEIDALLAGIGLDTGSLRDGNTDSDGAAAPGDAANVMPPPNGAAGPKPNGTLSNQSEIDRLFS